MTLIKLTREYDRFMKRLFLITKLLDDLQLNYKWLVSNELSLNVLKKELRKNYELTMKIQTEVKKIPAFKDVILKINNIVNKYTSIDTSINNLFANRKDLLLACEKNRLIMSKIKYRKKEIILELIANRKN